MNKLPQYEKATHRLNDLIDELTRLIDEPRRIFYSQTLNKLGDLHIALETGDPDALNKIRSAIPMLNDLKENLEWEQKRLSDGAHSGTQTTIQFDD